MGDPAVTIGVLTYGDYPELARRSIESIRRHCRRADYRLVVGANAVSRRTRTYLEQLAAAGGIDRLLVSDVNLNKCPMMRRMLDDVSTEFVWWFDDDSHVVSATALPERLRIARPAPATEVMWGEVYYFADEREFSEGTDVAGYVRRARWYRGLPGPERWVFVTGGCWWMRTSALRALDWPAPGLIKKNDDVLLGEAIRQQGWTLRDIGPCGTAANTEPRRGGGEDRETMERQMAHGESS